MRTVTVQPFVKTRQAGLPLYVQVVDHFRSHLTQGIWQPGDVLPALDVLTAQMGVARVTLRDAVKILSDEGLLRPERGRGTLVTDKAQSHRPLKLETRFEQLNEGLKLDRPAEEIFSEGPKMPVTGDIPGTLAAGYYHIKRVHLRDELRYCLITLFVERNLFDQYAPRFRTEMALPLIDEVAPKSMAKINQYMRFGKADAAVSAALTYPLGDPVAFVKRVVCDGAGQIIYFAEVTYRADLLEIDTEVSRD